MSSIRWDCRVKHQPGLDRCRPWGAAEFASMGSVSVGVVLLGGSAPGLVAAARCGPYWDLAALACLGLDLSTVVAGTGLVHQLA